MLQDLFTRHLVDLELQRTFKYDQVAGVSIQDSPGFLLAPETSLLQAVSHVEPAIRTVEETLVDHHSMVVVLVLLGECEKINE